MEIAPQGSFFNAPIQQKVVTLKMHPNYGHILSALVG
jgi:hypothetical protein